VFDSKLEHARFALAERDQDLSPIGAGKCIFKCVGQQLIQNQAAGNCLFYPELDWLERGFDGDAARLVYEGVPQASYKLQRVFGKVDSVEPVALIKLLVNERHRENALIAFFQCELGFI